MSDPRPNDLSFAPGLAAPPPLALLHENDEWLEDLRAALDERGVPHVPIRVDDAAVRLDQPAAFPVVLNKVSPSSYLRGHGPAIPFARALLELMEQSGSRVLNGSTAFRIETSKAAQLLLLRRLGLRTPRTLLFDRPRAALELAWDFPFPAVLKPDCGGSGAHVHRVEDLDHLAQLLRDGVLEVGGPDGLWLLQEELHPADGTIVRTELIDGELVYAMRVRATNTFNLCPAQACARPAVDAAGATPRVEFEPYLDIPDAAVAESRQVLLAARLDVGGVEFVELEDGSRSTFDVNATSVYRRDVSEAFEVDALTRLVDFLEREVVRSRSETGRLPRVG